MLVLPFAMFTTLALGQLTCSVYFNDVMKCQDGFHCGPGFHPGMGLGWGAPGGWDCCKKGNHGGRARCPGNMPHLCPWSWNCGGGDHCCSSAPCSGERREPNCMVGGNDWGGGNVVRSAGVGAMSTPNLGTSPTPPNQPYDSQACPNTGMVDVYKCSDGYHCGPGWKHQYSENGVYGGQGDYDCCSKHQRGGRVMCSSNESHMCGYSTKCGGGDYCCASQHCGGELGAEQKKPYCPSGSGQDVHSAQVPNLGVSPMHGGGGGHGGGGWGQNCQTYYYDVMKCADGYHCGPGWKSYYSNQGVYGGYGGWNCCRDRGSHRAACPSNLPNMCQWSYSCGGGDYCCASSHCGGSLGGEITEPYCPGGGGQDVHMANPNLGSTGAMMGAPNLGAVSPETKDKVQHGAQATAQFGKEFYEGHKQDMDTVAQRASTAGKDFYQQNKAQIDADVAAGKMWVKDHQDDIKRGVKQAGQWTKEHEDDIMNVVKQIVANIHIPPDAKQKAEKLMEQLLELLMSKTAPGANTKPADPTLGSSI